MYQVIARKYRPQRFDDVVRQDHVKRTLANAIAQGRIGHGYIFSGPRGTGKTTVARILAMCLNCTDGPKAEPDPDDPVCQEIAAGSAMDVIEIDAASNRRIDDIRELRESVRYRPARDRYKVFIIDEAHQITTDAFNALLKTLEEPPEWVVFVLCTTEPQAIPSTILSRCQSFQFRTVELDYVVERLRWICEQEGIEASDDALTAIALAGDGSIRDSLSTLDQAIASCGRTLDADAVRELLGAIPSEVVDGILAALGSGDAEAMLEIAGRLFREGRHPQSFVGELCRHFRNLLVMKISGADTRLVTAGKEERQRAAKAIENFTEEDLTRYVQLLLDLYRDLQNASQPGFRLELGLLKLVYAGHLRPIEQVLAEWGGAVPEQRPAAAATAATRPVPAKLEKRPAPAAKPAASRPPGGESAKMRLVRALRAAGDDFIADAIEASQIEETGGLLTVRASPENRTALDLGWDSLEAALAKAGEPRLRAKLGDDLDESAAKNAPSASPVASSEPLETDGEASRKALSDPDIQAFRERFPGQIREIRSLKEYSS